MIYRLPAADELLDQGDLVDGCPLLSVIEFSPGKPNPVAYCFGACLRA